MCFSPAVSLLTALIEFSLAGIILWKGRKSTVTRFITALIILLGVYQFTEFMICTTGNVVLWGTLGYVTYTILPALGLHFVLKLIHPEQDFFLLYIPAVIFQGFALFSREFIVKGACKTIFVSVENTLFQNDNIVFLIYVLYYFGYIFAAIFLLGRTYYHEKEKKRRTMYALISMGFLVSLLPPGIFIIIFPAWSIMFPSIYCEFALIFAIIAFLAAHIDETSTG